MRSDESGSSTIEYVIMIAAVLLASLGAWALLGDNVEASARCAADAVAGRAGGGCGGSARAGTDPSIPPVEHDRGDPTATPPPDAVPEPAPEPAPTPPPSRSPIDDLFAFGGGLVGGFVEGGAEMVQSTVGLAVGTLGVAGDMITHPGETMAAAADVATHLDRAVPAALDTAGALANGVWTGLQHAGDTLIHGSWEQRGHLFGRGLFEVASTAVPVTKVASLAHVAHGVTHAADVAHAAQGAHAAADAAHGANAAVDAAQAAHAAGGGGAFAMAAGVTRKRALAKAEVANVELLNPELTALAPAQLYRRLIIKGLTKEEAGNLTAWAHGLPITPGAAWTPREISRLEFLSHLQATGRLPP